MELTVKLFITIVFLLFMIGLSLFYLKKEKDEKFKIEIENKSLKKTNISLQTVCKEHKKYNSLYNNYETVALLALLSRKPSTSMIRSRLDEYNQGDNDHFYVYISFLKGDNIVHYKWKIEMKYWDLFEKANTTRLSPNEHCIYGNTSKLLELI